LKETGAWLETVCAWTLALQREFDDIAWGSEGKDARYLSKPRRLLGKPQEGMASRSCTWLRKWPERGLLERRQATNPGGRGLRLTKHSGQPRQWTSEVDQKGFSLDNKGNKTDGARRTKRWG
jgi:hypothetical protein